MEPRDARRKVLEADETLAAISKLRAYNANGDVMSVGKKQSTPRRSKPWHASRNATGVKSGAEKSTPMKPLTWRSNNRMV